ncbi:NB-ARC domain-containing protein [Anabaena sphaerica FACHB-251]|uniref:NB-ARC domain-containing protein n=1 Tax=Anabaena sphaerica FACHB-251 TaxID=2692883 RepID=A0A926WLG1_9NOST|nr:NB-ARC domain-containing protein [Anabaena sphaerica]MBD2295586.1 NB-ARC domain-containing protein [Anabaena sphaerica FACHB-251]
MSVADSQPPEEEFIEAQKNWDLEKLYVDLGSAKRKALTPVEKKLLRGLLCGCSPAEIAKRVYQSRNSGTVRVYLSNGLYKYIEDMLSNQLGYSVKVKNWSHVTHLLEKAGYKKNWFAVKQITTLIKNIREQEPNVLKVESTKIQDWGEAVDVSGFCGRMTELTTVSEWIVQQHCRLVVVLGMGGIGKTAFSIKLAQEIQVQFECVIWRSLHLCPTIDAMLTDIMQTLSPTLQIEQAATLNTKISQLIHSLRQMRCLLVLDNVDSILCSGDANLATTSKPDLLSQTQYRPGYEGYGELIRRLGDSQHQSCLLITSREKPPEIAASEGEKLPVRSLKLTGLSKTESLVILEAKGLLIPDYTDNGVFIDWYGGNPLFLKLVATTIQNLFGGSIYQFLKQGTIVFGDIRRILDQQFNHLSELEKYIMYWLVLNPDCTSVLTLTSLMIPGWSPRLRQRLILETLELLQRRSFLDMQAANLFPSAVWREYIIERVREKDFQSSTETETSLLMRDPILEAQLKNYVKKSQYDNQI